MTPGHRSVHVAVADAVATVTLNRPESRNALTADLIKELRAAMAALDADSSVRVIVLTGAGTAFCAGLDLKELRSTGANLRETAPDRADGRPWAPLHKPVIGAINGPAYTGGLEIALNCDIVIAAEEAVFADTHARVGVMPGWGLSVLLPAAVGECTAKAMSIAGLRLDAHAAYRRGFVVEVVPLNQLIERARELAANVAAADPASISKMLDIYRATAGQDRLHAFATETRMGQRWLECRVLD